MLNNMEYEQEDMLTPITPTSPVGEAGEEATLSDEAETAQAPSSGGGRFGVALAIILSIIALRI